MKKQFDRFLLTDQIAQVRPEAATSKTTIQAAVRATASTSVTTVEQLAALPDVLAWGLFAMTSMDVADAQLDTVQTQADLDKVIFHPSWGVPESIKTNDILPSLVRGSNRILERYNLRLAPPEPA